MIDRERHQEFQSHQEHRRQILFDDKATCDCDRCAEFDQMIEMQTLIVMARS